MAELLECMSGRLEAEDISISASTLEDVLAQLVADDALQHVAERWTEEQLTPASLLSRAEADLCSILRNTQRRPEHRNLMESGLARPFTTEDVRTAIEAFQESTSSLEARIQITKSQLARAKRVKENQARIQCRQLESLESTHGRNELKGQRITAHVKELADGIEAQLQQYHIDVSATIGGLSPAVSDKLRDDDQMIQHLEIMTAELELVGRGKSAESHVDDLITTLIELVCGEISQRLNRIYLSHVRQLLPPTQHEGTKTLRDSHDEPLERSLEEELTSLYSELEALATMASQQAAQKPVLQVLHHDLRDCQKMRKTNLNHAVQVLDFLGSTNRDMHQRIELCSSHRTTVQNLKASIAAHISNQTTASVTECIQEIVSGRNEPSSLSDNLILLERHLSVEDVQSKDKSSTSQLIDEKLARLVELLRTLISTAFVPSEYFVTSPGDAHQILTDTLHASSTCGAVVLSELGLERDLAYLQEHVGLVTHAVAGVDVDAMLHQDKTQEDLLSRWL